tara:strand:- start:2034 stop:2384 length:351 start_codon:yes stop_codon:yes gene_type:complete
VTLLGSVGDTTLLYFDIFEFIQHNSSFIPIWLVVIWASFAMTIGHSLNWLIDKKILGSFLGAIFGPLSYLSGLKFNLIAFPDLYSNIALLSAYWFMMMLIILNFYDSRFLKRLEKR